MKLSKILLSNFIFAFFLLGLYWFKTQPQAEVRGRMDVAEVEPVIDFEQELWLVVQSWREAEGLAFYSSNDNLCYFASLRLGEIKNDFSHDGFYGLEEDLFAIERFEKLAENLARFHEETDAASILNTWLESPKHRDNLAADYTHACLQCKDFYCVQLFGKY